MDGLAKLSEGISHVFTKKGVFWSTKFSSIDKAGESTWQSFTETTIDCKLVNKYLFTSLNAKPQKAYKIFVMDPR